MRLALSALLFFVVVYITTAQETGESQVYNYFPYYGPNARFLITSTTTSTSVTTTTSTIVCTSSVWAVGSPSFVALVAVCPAGRRRRGIVFEEEDNNEQFSISPSAVQKVEATASPIREARAADPQYLMMSPFGYSYYPQEIQPGFYGPAPLPYYGSYVPQPVAGNRIFLSTILNAVLPPFLKQTSTVTATSTAFTVVTSTSVPACKPIPAVLQCV